MIFFIAGVFVGVVISFFALGLIMANDMEEKRIEARQIKMEEQSDVPDKCRRCHYLDFASEPFDCATCHNNVNEC